MRAVYDYLQDRYLDDYVRAVQARYAHGIQEEPMAPWGWRSLPSHARARWLGSQHVEQFDTDEYGRLQAGSEWVHRKGQKRLFDIRAITEASFLGRTPEGDIISTWEPSQVMKRFQMLGFTDALTICGAVKAGPGSPMADALPSCGAGWHRSVVTDRHLFVWACIYGAGSERNAKDRWAPISRVLLRNPPIFSNQVDHGSGWESNPPMPAARGHPPILKTGAPTGAHPPPKTPL